MRHGFVARCIGLTICAALAVLTPMTAVAQERTGRFQQTVDFSTTKTAKLDATVGPVKITTVEFTDLGRGYSGSGFGSRLRGGNGSELSTAVRARFMVDNPTRDEWELTISLEFLDKDGKVVDKLTRKNDYDDETATWNIEHSLLEYVMPLVSRVRVTIEGRLN